MTVAALRFDSAGGRSFQLAGLKEEFAARRPEEVPAVLDRVEAAAADGLHAAGFVTYEAATAFERAFRVHDPDARLPLCWFGAFRERLETGPPTPGGGYELGEWRATLDKEAYRERVERIRDLIAAGDSYQVNLTFPLHAGFSGDPAALYADLARAQRAGYAALLDFGEVAVVSLSPELFFHLRGRDLKLKPMKGTRPRGRWREEDQLLAADLAGTPKERAENLMIVDMLRNDAGRLAVPGSVRVPRLYEVESYPTVYQMTSTVEARTRPGTRLRDVFAALFPCGSVTGAPKVRTVEIIRELEDTPRGVYTGAVGFVSGGEAVFNVAIRTLLVERSPGTAQMGVGSGIVHESDPVAEYQECLQKAAFTRVPGADFELLETLLWEPEDGFYLLARHLRRMAWSAERFCFPFDRDRALRALEGACTDKREPLKVRLTLDRSGRFRARTLPLAESREPLRVTICDQPVEEGPLLYHKTTYRSPYESRAARHPGADEVILVNDRGQLTESTTANLVLRIDGECLTPPLSCGLLPGVMRAELLARGEVRERVLIPEDLRRAEEFWLVNSVTGRRRARLQGEAPG